tara:strand:- start:309 stop:497 length:189 start_codon:yes stop_codon:yes gene_type:complete
MAKNAVLYLDSHGDDAKVLSVNKPHNKAVSTVQMSFVNNNPNRAKGLKVRDAYKIAVGAWKG